MSEMDRFKQTYFVECAELLQELEELLTDAEEDGGDTDAANAVFRAVHSIKGGAGAFGFTELVNFTHYFENLLDLVRQGEQPFSPQFAATALMATDVINDLVGAAEEGREVDPGRVEKARAELARVTGVDDDDGPPGEDDDDDFGFTPIAVDDDEDDGESEDADALADFAAMLDSDDLEAAEDVAWKIVFTPFDTLYLRGVDPLLLFSDLAELGPVDVTCTAELPALDEYDAGRSYLSWTLILRADVPEERVEEVFDFAIGDCTLTITPSDANDDAGDDDVPTGEAAPPARGAGEETPGLEDLLNAAEAATGTPSASDSAPPPEGSGAPGDAAKTPSSEADKPAEKAAPKAPQTIRVELDRVDRVSDMASEIVITQAGVVQQIDDALRHTHPDLARSLEVLAQQTRVLQDAIMAIRAQPVKTVFARIPRLIRQLADETDKQVRLETHGEHTEIDKTIIEELTNPLTHMIRNAVDHGIEPPEDRVALGKPEAGTIVLSAAQQSGRIIIKIEDDGRGIAREKVLKKAIEKGLVEPDARLTDEEIDGLIFRPGFSTAETTSNISGRGVGMDVVLSSITAMGGRVTVASNPGEGSAITLSLPLTLAVLDVMVVVVGKETFVAPLSSIVECTLERELKKGRLPDGSPVVDFRGEMIELIDLTDMLGHPADKAEERFFIICDCEAYGRAALLVDRVVGQQQVAIKSLESNFGRVEGFAGATVMGDGRVALILDAVGVLRRWRADGRARAA